MEETLNEALLSKTLRGLFETKSRNPANNPVKLSRSLT